MLKSFDGLVLLKEIGHIAGVELENDIRKKYKKYIIIINRISFLPYKFLPIQIQKQITKLDDYFLISYLCKEACVNRRVFSLRIEIMKRQNVNLFEYKKICNYYFIKINEKQKKLLQKYNAIRVNLNYMKNKNNKQWMNDIIFFGDIGIALY